MQLIDLRHHSIGQGGIILMPEHGGEWYVVPSDNDGHQHRCVEEMTREARRSAAEASEPAARR